MGDVAHIVAGWSVVVAGWSVGVGSVVVGSRGTPGGANGAATSPTSCETIHGRDIGSYCRLPSASSPQPTRSEAHEQVAGVKERAKTSSTACAMRTFESLLPIR